MTSAATYIAISATPATNISNQTSSKGDYRDLETAADVVNLLLLGCVSYLSVAYVFYSVKSRKWNRRRKNDISGGLVLNLALLGSVLVIPRIVITRTLLYVGRPDTETTDWQCDVVMDFSTAAFFVALVPSYTFLWARQRALYGQPSINRLYTKLIRFLCWSSYVIPFASGLMISILFIYPDAYRGSRNGCVLKEDEKSNDGGFYGMIFAQVMGQILLLGLFLYPLALHRNLQRKLSVIPAQTHNGDDDVAVTPSCPSRDSTGKSPRSECAKSAAEENGKEASKDDECSSRLRSTSCKSFVVNKFPETCRTLEMGRMSNGQIRRTRSDSCMTKTKRAPIQRSFNTLKGKISTGVKSLRHKPLATSSGNVANKNRVLRVIRRSVVCAAVCIVSDLVAMATVVLVVDKSSPKSWTNTVYDISLLINVLSVTLSFESYRKMLWPFCAAARNSFPSQSYANSRSQSQAA